MPKTKTSQKNSKVLKKQMLSKPRSLIGHPTKITEDIHHKVKVVNRKREIMKMRNDIENEQILPHQFIGTHPLEMGETEFAKERRLKLERNRISKMICKGIGMLIVVALLYPLAIMIIDLW